MFARLRSYLPTAILATLIFYFGFQALTGPRGFLSVRQRSYTLEQKTAELAKLDKLIADMAQEESALTKTANGETPEAQKLRSLENSLDKALLKIQEAVHIGDAYHAIISKLQEVRHSYLSHCLTCGRSACSSTARLSPC